MINLHIASTSHSPQPLGWGSGRVILCRTILMVSKMTLTQKETLTCLLTLTHDSGHI